MRERVCEEGQEARVVAVRAGRREPRMAAVLPQHPDDLIAARAVAARHKDEHARAVVAVLDREIFFPEVRVEAVRVEPARDCDAPAVEVELDGLYLDSGHSLVHAERHAPVHFEHPHVLPAVRDSVARRLERARPEDEARRVPLALVLEEEHAGLAGRGALRVRPRRAREKNQDGEESFHAATLSTRIVVWKRTQGSVAFLTLPTRAPQRRGAPTDYFPDGV